MQRPYNVLSPHLDDAALSCSLLLAANLGSSITTVFAAGPESVRPLPPWDAAARYFAQGADVMRVRRAEDASAAALVGAATVHLPYWDGHYRTGQYGYQGPQGEDLTAAIAADLAGRAAGQPGRPWVIPIGLGHPDHRMTAEAGLRVAETVEATFYAYADLPYAQESRDELADRKAYFSQRGFALQDCDAIEIGADRRLKRDVISCHASQRRTLRRRARTAVRAPERVWALVRQ
jgi:LmbE family N-acetylglucosaminyl deacetylase